MIDHITTLQCRSPADLCSSVSLLGFQLNDFDCDRIQCFVFFFPSHYSLNYPVAAVVERPEEGSEKGTGGKVGGREEASEHRAPGPAPPPQPTAGACQDRPAGWTQPGTPHPSPAAAEPESALSLAGSQER